MTEVNTFLERHRNSSAEAAARPEHIAAGDCVAFNCVLRAA